MNISASTTICISGVSLTLAVQTSAEDLRTLLELGATEIEDDALLDLFHKSLQETLPVLQKFRDALSQNLKVGSIKHLMQKLEEEGILPSITAPPTQEPEA